MTLEQVTVKIKDLEHQMAHMKGGCRPCELRRYEARLTELRALKVNLKKRK